MEAIPFCFLLNKTHLFQSNTTQISFNSTGYSYMYATCFGHTLRLLRSLLYLPLHGFCIEMPEAGLRTGRNMYHTFKGNQLN